MSPDIPGVSIRDYFDRLLTEHDRRNEQRFAAMERAIAKAEEVQERALIVAKKEADSANRKLEEALVAYKASQNEWQKTFSEYREAIKGDTLPRGETLATFDKHFGLIQKLETEIGKIENLQSEGRGGVATASKIRSQSNWFISLAIGVGLALLGTLTSLVLFFLSKGG